MPHQLGVNYWPSYSGPAMWRDFREDEIAADLRALAGAGIGYIRAFLFWPDFMPGPDRVAPEMLARLERFLTLCRQADLRVHLTFLVGHMSGQNWPPAWMPDPSRLFTDPALLLAQERYFDQVIHAVRSSPAIEAYVLSNELPIFTGPAPAAAVEAWASRMYALLKALDPGRPVGLGDGAWYLLGELGSGFRATHAQDVLAPHLYLADTHPARQTAAYGFAVAMARRMAAVAGKSEVWLEEFGATHSVFGEREVATWARQVVIEARLQGASRICWWCGFDFPDALRAAEPYSHHAHELSFGMMRPDRTPRPVAAALREAMEAPLPELPPAGLLVPSYLYREYPFGERPAAITFRAILNAYAALRHLGFRVEAVLEDDLASPGAALPPLLVAPSVQKLLAPTWERLTRYPGHLAYSYLHATQVRSHEGGWISAADARRFFGGEPHNRFNLAEAAPRMLIWTGEREGVSGPSPAGGPLAGSSMELPQVPDPFVSTPLVLEPREATVMGRDEQGRPLWARVGQRDLLLYPLEALAEDPATVAAYYAAAMGGRVPVRPQTA